MQPEVLGTSNALLSVDRLTRGLGWVRVGLGMGRLENFLCPVGWLRFVGLKLQICGEYISCIFANSLCENLQSVHHYIICT